MPRTLRDLPGRQNRRSHVLDELPGRARITSRSWSEGALADLDEMVVGIAEVAADLGAAVLGRGEESGAAGGPGLVHRLDVGDPDVEEGADAVGVGRGLQDDRGLVVGGTAADVDDDPAVGQ